jgi:hypothetical protein
MRRVVIAVASLLACSGPADADESATTDMSASSTSGSTTTAGSTGLDGSSSTGPPPGDGILECTETCTVPLDCCLPGTVGCPGAYPYNVDCRDGVCVPAFCVENDECTVAGEECHVVRGVATCVMPCAADPECTAPSTCAGSTDDGIAFCFERCDAPGVFCGNETCDPTTGLCLCTSSGQCQFNEDCLD